MSSLRSPSLTPTLLGKEVRSLLTGSTLWILLVILSVLTGYSFTQAVDLFSEASTTALQFPALARGMTPLDGVIVPTFGALYLVTTLLFPFVAIRMLGDEVQGGGLKLLLQSRLGLTRIVAVKMAALALGWLLALFTTLSAVGIWVWLDGHVFWPEVANLAVGYTLYALVVAAIAFFASALTESNATAAIVTLTFTLGSWVLDFAAGTQGWLHALSSLSLTVPLRTYEHGLFSLPQTLQTLLIAAGLLALCVVWLHPGRPIVRKLSYSAAVVACTAVLVVLVAPIQVYSDVSEDRRNSFNPADERALQQMTESLTITIYLSPSDSLAQELEQRVLPVLRRNIPQLDVVYADTGSPGTLGTSAGDKYGTVVYEYAGKTDESRSTSEEEILSILHALAGQNVTPDQVPEYPGYPLVADPAYLGIWFYGLLPALFGVLWWRARLLPRRRAKQGE